MFKEIVDVLFGLSVGEKRRQLRLKFRMGGLGPGLVRETDGYE